MSIAIRNRLYTGAQTRELDRLAVAAGTDGFELMCRAGEALLRVVQERWPGARELLVLAGPGNNGGDGLVVAALAARAGLDARVYSLVAPDHWRNEAAQALALARESGVDVVGPDAPLAAEALAERRGRARSCVVIDALLGTGISGEVRPAFREVIDAINRSGLSVVSADLPSGLQADTGAVACVAVRADVTVTFIGWKQGLFTGHGPDHSGHRVFERLSVGREIHDDPAVGTPASRRLAVQQVLPWLPRRRPATHKGDCGRVAVVGGDLGFGGAALLSSQAAARSGAGTVCLATRPEHVTASLVRCPEVMARGVGDEPVRQGRVLAALLPVLQSATALVVGPGLGQGEWSLALLREVLQWQRDGGLPVVLDADALNLLASPAGSGLPEPLPDLTVLTPHPGEAARLLGCSIAEVQADRFAAVRALRQRWGGCVVLKGAGSLIACADQQPGGITGSTGVAVDVCTEGNPGLATGGTGDILAGLTGGLLAQRMPLDRAVRAAVAIHGESGDLAAGEGQRGMLASDLLTGIRELVSRSVEGVE